MIGGQIRSSVTDFTLRVNPSNDNLATQANEELPLAGQALRQSLELNIMPTQEEEIKEVIGEEGEGEDQFNPIESTHLDLANMMDQSGSTT